MSLNTISRSFRLSAQRCVGMVQRRSLATQTPLKEYFVLVWDKPGADRSQIKESELVPSFVTFAGECLGETTASQPKVIGNGFSCNARSVEEVKANMKDSIYGTKGVWDLETASINPLLTVHSRAFGINTQ